jgi:plasmid stabilization system protein ParE
MFRTHAVHTTPQAESDIQGIYAHLSVESGAVAELVYSELYKSILSLGQLLERFPLARDIRLRRAKIRVASAVSYFVYFLVEREVVYVLCVWHSARRSPRHIVS